MVEADEFYIEQLFTNLLVNAIEASPVEKDLTVTIAYESELCLRMTNAGVIPADIRDHLFEKNVTSGQSRKGRD